MDGFVNVLRVEWIKVDQMREEEKQSSTICKIVLDFR